MNQPHQVWTVAYDGDPPYMDGTHPVIRMSESDDLERVRINLRVVEQRSVRSPKRNLRIQTRLVTDWEDDE